MKSVTSKSICSPCYEKLPTMRNELRDLFTRARKDDLEAIDRIQYLTFKLLEASDQQEPYLDVCNCDQSGCEYNVFRNAIRGV
jgi:hypothetical protein